MHTTWQTQSPDDVLPNAFDFAAEIAAGETIVPSSVNLIATPTTLLLGTPAAGGAAVSVPVGPGPAATACKVMCIAQSSQGRIVVGTAHLYVGPVGLDTGG